MFQFPFGGGLFSGAVLGSTVRASFSTSGLASASKADASTIFVLLIVFLTLTSNWKSLSSGFEGCTGGGPKLV